MAWRSTMIIVGLAGVLVLAGCPDREQPAAPEDERPEAAAEVEMTELEFAPNYVTVRAGQTVRLRNTSGVAHTVTADPQQAADPANVQLPEGLEAFDSGTMQPGATFEHTFEVPGHYRYVCLPHEGAGMIAEVHVNPAD